MWSLPKTIPRTTFWEALLYSMHPAEYNSVCFEVRKWSKCNKDSSLKLNWRGKTIEKEKTDMVFGNNGGKCNKTTMHMFAVTLNSFKYFHTNPLYCDAFAIAGTVWSKSKHVCNTISSCGRGRKNSWLIKCAVWEQPSSNGNINPLAASAEFLLSAFHGCATGKVCVECPLKMHS